MHVEIRTDGKRKIYYLAYSFRYNGRVRKIRLYLGSGLSDSQIRKKRHAAEEEIRRRLTEYKRIRDPLHTVLSPAEREEIDTIISRAGLSVYNLSEDEWRQFTELFTFHTNAIEGSTVTFTEVKNILEHDRWPDRTKAEISETYGVDAAVDYIRKTKDHLSIDLIKKLHQLVFSNSKPFAGTFRGRGVEVAVVDGSGAVIHKGAPQKEIGRLLRELVNWYHKQNATYHPLVLAVVVHNQFETIHPFQDGNGRVGRLLLNNILLRHSLPPVNIDLNNRIPYYSALQAYQREGNIRPMIELLLKEYRRQK